MSLQDTLSIHSSGFLLASAMLCALSAPALHAQGTMPVRPVAGCQDPRTPIDTAPFTITKSGSYFLTSNLTGVAGQNGIMIEASDATIDMNGFALTGVEGSLSGIATSNAHTIESIRIFNGNISAWGEDGVRLLASTVELTGLLSRSNGDDGFEVDANGQIEACRADANDSGHGFELSGALITKYCSVRSGLHGIKALGGRGLRVDSCAIEATGKGIQSSGTGAVITTSVTNASEALLATGATLSHCNAIGMPDTYVLKKSTATHCLASSIYADAGFVLKSTGSLVECMTTTNSIGVTGSGTVMRSYAYGSGMAYGMYMTGTGARVVDCFVDNATTGFYQWGSPNLVIGSMVGAAGIAFSAGPNVGPITLPDDPAATIHSNFDM